VRPRRVVTPPALGTDAIPFVHRGIECLTFASGSLGRATMAVHSAGDVPSNLDREPLEQAARVARAVALELVSQPRRR
jgi:Zn-dependent M28 family amino/carboxypeptidase